MEQQSYYLMWMLRFVLKHKSYFDPQIKDNGLVNFTFT